MKTTKTFDLFLHRTECGSISSWHCARLTLGLAVVFFLSACNNGGNDNSLLEIVARWNRIATDAVGLDHTPSNIGAPHSFGAQLGPCRASRALAIVQVAVFEALNAITGGYQSYVGLAAAPSGAALSAAIAQAAHDALVALYPSQGAIFATYLERDLASVPNAARRELGVQTGRSAATAILALRSADNSSLPEPLYGTEFIPNPNPGFWRQDPVSQVPIALGANWPSVTPFTMSSASQFRSVAPPALTSAEYAAAYNEVQTLGGDGVVTPTTRTIDQTFKGIYWGYDGTALLGPPPRMFNQIALQLAESQGLDGTGLARLLALVNVAMADAGIACWETKYFYQYWRPITGIREADVGTGPTGLGDGNPNTSGDINYLPLGAPASNQSGVDFTPPFPAYPSGHATFAGAVFQVLRREFGTDVIPFTFISDEYNGVTTDSAGVPRVVHPRSFATLTEAEEENGQSRIYLGIHWVFDKTAGVTMGNSVGNQAYDTLYLPMN